MDRKSKIFILSIIFTLFITSMIILIVFKKPQEEETEETEIVYAVNETQNRDENETEEIEEDEEEITEYISEIEISHLERLTENQTKKKSDMAKILNSCSKFDIEEHGKVVSEEVMNISTRFHVYILVNFEDGSSETYVCDFDDTNMHKFLRCVSLQEWNDINEGKNVG